MLPFLFNPALLKMVRAPSKSLVLSAALTASSPQHIFACWRRPLVNLASPVSRKCHMSWPCFPLQWEAAHSKTWTRRLSTYSIWGVRRKNTCMGEIQSFARWSGYQVSSSIVCCSVCVLNSACALSAGFSRAMSDSSLLSTSYTISVLFPLLSTGLVVCDAIERNTVYHCCLHCLCLVNLELMI